MMAASKKEYGDFSCPFFGNQDAKIVHISQAPSLSVIKNQKPFSDKSGKKLRKEWYNISDETFYNPDNFYFTAIGMYFPGKDAKGADKKPTYNWAEKWLKKELKYLNPDLFIIVGKVAADFFFPKQDFNKLVFSDQAINEIETIVLPHPSPANIRWFMQHPDFKEKRLPEIQKIIHKALDEINY